MQHKVLITAGGNRRLIRFMCTDVPGGLNERDGKYLHINDQVIVVFDMLSPQCRIIVIVQGIPVTEEVLDLQQERSILPVLW